MDTQIIIYYFYLNLTDCRKDKSWKFSKLSEKPPSQKSNPRPFAYRENSQTEWKGLRNGLRTFRIPWKFLNWVKIAKGGGNRTQDYLHTVKICKFSEKLPKTGVKPMPFRVPCWLRQFSSSLEIFNSYDFFIRQFDWGKTNKVWSPQFSFGKKIQNIFIILVNVLHDTFTYAFRNTF